MSGDESDDNWVSDSVDDGDEGPADIGGDAGQFGDTGRPGDAGDRPSAGDSSQSTGREKGPDEKFCVECGTAINEKAEICPACGVRQPDAQSSDDERLIAALLAIFLGGIGAHKFYLGKTGQGILYLCFFWTAIPALIGIVEGIIYLSKSDEEFRRQYLED